MIHHTLALLLAVSLSLASASPLPSDASHCCVARQYELQAQLTYDVMGSYISAGEITRMSLDIDKQLISMNQVMNGKYELTILIDYTKQTMYVVTKATGRCEKNPLPKGMTLDYCIPDSAEHLRHTKLGYGANTLDCDTWAFGKQYEDSSVKVVVTVESEGCIPVHEQITMSNPSQTTSETMFFYNYNPSIKDPSVFELPAACKETTRPDVNLLSRGARALVRKYAHL